MKKILSWIGLALVLSVFGSVRTAAAFGQSAWEYRTSRVPEQSHEERSPRGESRSGFRENLGHREVRFQRPAHHYERQLPVGCRTLRIANRILYCLNGIYYQWTPYGYEVVTAPVGAIVRELPPGYCQIFYGGTLYYVYNNAYYVRGPLGYNLVTPPSQIVLCPTRTVW
jgi:hypothetical protein